MYSLIKKSPHKYSGRLRAHEHTSYLPLAILILIVGIVLVESSIPIVSASPPPQADSVSLTGSVAGTPPKVAATITSPTNQQHFASSPITVAGSCPTGTLVEIYKNDIFAGSTPCGNNGQYTISVDLLYGQNSLTAQVYDVLNQAGPMSNPVIVYYDATALQSAPLSLLNFSGSQLILSTDAVYRGTFPDQMLNVPITIIGGTAPFAVNVEWGDASNKVIPRSDNTTFNAGHEYQKPGTYQITLQGTDSQGRVAFMTVAAIVNGQPPVAGSSGSTKPTTTNKLLVLWPLYAVVVTLVISFWLGERREKRLLLAPALAQTPPTGIVSQT